MDTYRVIEVKQSIFADNNQDADRLRQQMKEDKTFLINLMSSPGSGKTTTLTKLIAALKDDLRIGVMEADIDSDVDAKTLLAAGIPAVQLHTGGMCHLDADMTRQGLAALAGITNPALGTPGFESPRFDGPGLEDTRPEVPGLDLVVLENIGNLVCPAEFDTGAAINMTILSVPEGDDKPAKYPLMYETCDLMVVNKIDAMPVFDFDTEKVERYAKLRNPKIKIFYISAKTGEGVAALAEEIVSRVAAWNA